MKLKIVLLVFLVLLCSCNIENEYQQSRMLMDTLVTITVYADSREKAQEAFDEAFSEIRRIEKKFSIYENTTASALNKEGIVKADEEFISVVESARHISKISNGSFDLTVQPVLDLYSTSFQDYHRPPTNEEISGAIELVDYNSIKVTGNNVSINESMNVTFGGIVKGYAIDRASGVLKNNNIKSALINAGGDMYGYGVKRNKEPWRIAIKKPDEGYMMNMPIRDSAVATSGNYERYFNENKSFHHIVNPKTGYSANESISATVIAGNASMADALATAVFVMGPEDGMNLIESMEGVEAMLIGSDKKIYYSTGMQHE